MNGVTKTIYVSTASLFLMCCSGKTGAESDHGEGGAYTTTGGTDPIGDSGGGAAGPAFPSGCDPIVPAAAYECIETACKDESCGQTSSIYDASGCIKTCDDDLGCANGEKCSERPYAPVSCDGEAPCHCGNLSIAKTVKACGPPI